MKTFFLFALALPNLAAATPTLEEALSRVRANVEVFENKLPDFVCKEKITSRTIEEKDGTVKSENVIESTFSGRQNRSGPAKFRRMTFTEDRQIETVNGGRWKDKSMPKHVFLIGGGFSSSLISIFGAKGAANYSFSMEQDPAGLLAIAFVTRGDNQKILEQHSTHVFHEKGRAWFDPVSFEIIRLERRIVPADGGPSNDLPITIDFQPVRIGEETFRLPGHVAATAHREVRGMAERGEYQADYSDYRKFGASTSIQFSDAPN